jgi:hypothetical protein
VYSSLLTAAQKEKGVKLLKMLLMLGVRSPQSIACGVGASVSRIELYNSDKIVSFVYVLYVILLLLFTYVPITVIHLCLLYV